MARTRSLLKFHFVLAGCAFFCLDLTGRHVGNVTMSESESSEREGPNPPLRHGEGLALTRARGVGSISTMDFVSTSRRTGAGESTLPSSYLGYNAPASGALAKLPSMTSPPTTTATTSPAISVGGPTGISLLAAPELGAGKTTANAGATAPGGGSSTGSGQAGGQAGAAPLVKGTASTGLEQLDAGALKQILESLQSGDISGLLKNIQEQIGGAIGGGLGGGKQ